MKGSVVFGFLFLMSFSVNAQINRNIGGVILGETTKEEVKSHLLEKRNFYEDKDDGNAIQSVNEISFGGVLWSRVYYEFYKDILFRATFTKVVRGKENEIRSKYKELRENLYRKYMKRIPKDNSKDYSPKTQIKDKSSFIKLSITQDSRRPGTKYLKLTYLDTTMDAKKKKQGIDEL